MSGFGAVSAFCYCGVLFRPALPAQFSINQNSNMQVEKRTSLKKIIKTLEAESEEKRIKALLFVMNCINSESYFRAPKNFQDLEKRVWQNLRISGGLSSKSHEQEGWH